MMKKPFFTKKQKARMRERRQKKKKLASSSNLDISDNTTITSRTKDVVTKTNDEILKHETSISSKKRPRESEEDVTGTDKDDINKVNLLLTKTTTTTPNHLELTTKRMNGKVLVLLPSDLSGKDAKKFRKDARRKLRDLYRDDEHHKITSDMEIEFVTREEMPSMTHLSIKKPKKGSKEFPSIKELLKQQQHLEEMQREENKLRDKLNQIPEAIRSQYVAMDCEMVGIGSEGRKSALARVSIVNWNYDIVLDTYVKVPLRVTDFRTHVSGVEPKHLQHGDALDVQSCRNVVTNLLKDKILIGHALSNDLKALMLAHPKDKIRDTAKYRPFQRYGNGKWRARKLRDLVKENLMGREEFQQGEHDSVQDAKATMELFQLVYTAWEKELAKNSK